MLALGIQVRYTVTLHLAVQTPAAGTAIRAPLHSNFYIEITDIRFIAVFELFLQFVCVSCELFIDAIGWLMQRDTAVM